MRAVRAALREGTLALAPAGIGPLNHDAAIRPLEDGAHLPTLRSFEERANDLGLPTVQRTEPHRPEPPHSPQLVDHLNGTAQVGGHLVCSHQRRAETVALERPRLRRPLVQRRWRAPSAAAARPRRRFGTRLSGCRALQRRLVAGAPGECPLADSVFAHAATSGAPARPGPAPRVRWHILVCLAFQDQEPLARRPLAPLSVVPGNGTARGARSCAARRGSRARSPARARACPRNRPGAARRRPGSLQ